MKKLVLILIAVISVQVVSAQSKIAHVNTQELLDTMPSRKQAIKEIRAFQEEGMKELMEMEDQLRKLYQEYQVAQEKGESPLMLEMKAKKIQAKEQAYQERQGTLEQDLQILSNRYNEPILQRVQEAVKIVSERKKLNYVLDISSTLFASGDDITKEVMVEVLRLEKEAADKGKKP
jgi:outer membrane protein